MSETGKKVKTKARRPPARTPEEMENRLISMAFETAERQLAEGTASSQVVTHFLKLATAKESLEKEKLRAENDLLKAKAENIKASRDREELYAEALEAMRKYSGVGEINEE